MSRTAFFDKETSQPNLGRSISEVVFQAFVTSLKAILPSMTPVQKGRLAEIIRNSNELSQSEIEQIFSPSQISDQQHELNKKKNQDNLFKWRNEQLACALTDAQVLTAPGVAKLLNTTRQTPHDRLKRHALFAIKDKGKMLFPVWQFDPNGPDGVVAGLPEILKILANKPPLTVMAWFTEPNDELGGLTPIKALQECKLEAVKCEAEIVAAL